jgi:hypothetical protein
LRGPSARRPASGSGVTFIPRTPRRA